MIVIFFLNYLIVVDVIFSIKVKAFQKNLILKVFISNIWYQLGIKLFYLNLTKIKIEKLL